MIVHFVIKVDMEDINDMTETELKHLFMKFQPNCEYSESDITVHIRPEDEYDEDIRPPWELDSPETL